MSVARYIVVGVITFILFAGVLYVYNRTTGELYTCTCITGTGGDAPVWSPAHRCPPETYPKKNQCP